MGATEIIVVTVEVLGSDYTYGGSKQQAAPLAQKKWRMGTA